MAIYWGVAIPGVTSTSLSSFETLAGKKISILGFGQTWASGALYPSQTYANFDTAKANLAHGRGAYVLYDWIPGNSVRSDLDDPNFNLRSIYQNHTHDTYITTQANTIKALGYPILIRPFHEMNGNWYQSYNEAGPNNLGNGHGELILAWQYIVNMFEAAGCTHLGPTPNVKWVFNPNNMSSTSSSSTFRALSQFYPGDNYVDFLAIDGYNDDSAWKTMQQVMEGGAGTGLQNTLANLQAVTTQPKQVIIAEVGCADTRGGVPDAASKAAWFTDCFDVYLPSRPQIVAVVYSHYNGPPNWSIDAPSGNTVTVPAFSAPNGIGSAYYLTGATFDLVPDIQAYWLSAGTPNRFKASITSMTGLVDHWPAQETTGNLTGDNGTVATAGGTPTYAVATTVVPSNPTQTSIGFAGDATSGFTIADAPAYSPANSTAGFSIAVPFLLTSLPVTNNGILIAKGDTGQFEWDIYVSASAGGPNWTVRNLANTASTDLNSVTALPLNKRLLLQARLGPGTAMALVVSSEDGGAWGDICNLTGTYSPTLSDGTAATVLGKRVRSTDHGINGDVAHWQVLNVAVSDNTWKEQYNTWLAAPVISAPAAGVVGSTATVTWTTNVGASSWVEFGTTSAYGSSAGLPNPTLVTSHSVPVAGLAAGTYHYKIHTRTTGGVEAVTTDATFTVAGAATTTQMHVMVA